MTSNGLRILILGHITNDYVDGQMYPGGPARYQIPIFLHYNNQVEIVTSASKLEFLPLHPNLQTHNIISTFTTSFEFTKKIDQPNFESDDRTMRLMHRANQIKISDLNTFIQNQNYDIVMVSPIVNELSSEILNYLPKLAKASFLDMQGTVRKFDENGYLVNEISLEMVNWAMETYDFTKISDVELGDLSLSDLPVRGNLLITKGSEGVILLQDGHCRTFPTIKIDKVADTTGSGDIFFATFALFSISQNVDVAINKAQQYSAHNLSKRGPPTLEEVSKWMD